VKLTWADGFVFFSDAGLNSQTQPRPGVQFVGIVR
jgi:hypothetical protein